jgi:hypothetical protein
MWGRGQLYDFFKPPIRKIIVSFWPFLAPALQGCEQVIYIPPDHKEMIQRHPEITMRHKEMTLRRREI